MTNPLFSHALSEEQLAAIPAEFQDQVRQLRDLVAQAKAECDRLLTVTGVWYHVSPRELPVGTVLTPGGPDGVTHAANEFYASTGLGSDTGTLADMGGPRTAFVWLSPNREDAEFWADILDATHLYEVEPAADPMPWNGTAADGWVTTAATITRAVKIGDRT